MITPGHSKGLLLGLFQGLLPNFQGYLQGILPGNSRDLFGENLQRFVVDLLHKTLPVFLHKLFWNSFNDSMIVGISSGDSFVYYSRNSLIPPFNDFPEIPLGISHSLIRTEFYRISPEIISGNPSEILLIIS